MGDIGAENGSDCDDTVFFPSTGEARYRASSNKIPRSVTRISIDRSVKDITADAFYCCTGLEEAYLPEGVEKIEGGAFYGCKSLGRIKVPSSVKCIDHSAFGGCHRLRRVELLEGLQRIGANAFVDCKSLSRIRAPSTAVEADEFAFGRGVIGASAFGHCNQLVSVEVSDETTTMHKDAFKNCPSLRNLAIPPPREHQRAVVVHCFEGCHDLMRIFGTREAIDGALKSRFADLPIHQMCYYHSYYPTEVVTGELLNAKAWGGLDDVDCLGMTPLHILACSAKQVPEIHQTVISVAPHSLVARDEWGCIPLLYAIWGNSPRAVMSIFVKGHKLYFPNFRLDWNGMIKTLCRAGACLETIQLLLDTQRLYFPKDDVDWEKCAREMMIRCFVRCNCLEDFASIWEDTVKVMETLYPNDEIFQSLQQMQLIMLYPFPSRVIQWQSVCERFTKPVKGWWLAKDHRTSFRVFRFLIGCDIPERVNAIGTKKRRADIESYLINDIRGISSRHLEAGFDTIHWKLVEYEFEYRRLVGATSLLELALWRARFHEAIVDKGGCHKKDGDDAALKVQCRISSGVDVIIPNVLSFLVGA